MPSIRAKPGTRCSAPLCEMEVIVKGMCWGHYRAALRGRPLTSGNLVKPGNTRGTAIKYGCRRPTWTERRYAMFDWWLREEMVTPEPTTGCLLWFGADMPGGYPRVGNCRDPWGGYGHRAALYFAGVRLPRGHDFHVRHTCDNPACVNINHLRLGTAQENVLDYRRRGRSPCTPVPKSWPLSFSPRPPTPRRREKCRRDHPCGYTTTAKGNRYCKTCDEQRVNRYRNKRRSVALAATGS